MDDFVGKVAVVTGTANPRGIGMAIARAVAGLGCSDAYLWGPRSRFLGP